ncbi:MAG: hypothetical protein ACE5EB_05980 [Thermodesulfobacteriota bacterium]
MSKRKKILAGVLSIAFVLFVAVSGARAWVREIELKKAGPEIEAKGMVYIRLAGFVPSDRLLVVEAYHLKARSVYSVWIIDKRSGKREALGITGQNHFKTDASGFGHYTDHTTEYILGWNRLEVAFHPGSDPSNTKDMIVVLRADLYQ